MYSEGLAGGRQAFSGRYFIGAFVAALMASGFVDGAAHAQELSHRFINPSFGGNPFYSDHLLGIANIHRPNEPEEEDDPPPTDADGIAANLRTRLLNQLSDAIRARLDNARPGDSGEFEVGNQRISFTRTQTEMRVTFVNTTTNETRTIIIPVTGGGSSFVAAPLGGRSGVPSAEQALGANGASANGGASVGLALPPL